VRITGGEYAGIPIICPKQSLRPTMDRVRESFFSSLGDITGAYFLDVFAGSGVVGLEAVSRGAGYVVMVERDGRKKAVIQQNIEKTKAKNCIAVRIMNAEGYIKHPEYSFDIVFMDPPFPFKNRAKLLSLAAANGCIKEGGLLLMHHPGNETLPDKTAGLELYKEKKYGHSRMVFYRYSGIE